MLSSKEIAIIDEIKKALENEIPQIEDDLLEKYGKSVLYKYYLGKSLAIYIDKYNIAYNERRKFWDEIKLFATKESRIRNEGTNSVTRREKFKEFSMINPKFQKLSIKAYGLKNIMHDVLKSRKSKEHKHFP